jgi:hypothetical protein
MSSSMYKYMVIAMVMVMFSIFALILVHSLSLVRVTYHTEDRFVVTFLSPSSTKYGRSRIQFPIRSLNLFYFQFT